MSKPPGNFPIEGLSSNVFTVNMYYNVMNATDETLGVEFATMIMPDLLSALGDKFAILLDPIECQPYNFTLQVTRDTYVYQKYLTLSPMFGVKIYQENVEVEKTDETGRIFLKTSRFANPGKFIS